MEGVEGLGLVSLSVEEVEGVELLYPSIEDSYLPYVGMCFKSIEEGEDFYKQYAKLSGFASRKYSTKYRPRSHELYARELVCSKQGGKVVGNKGFLIQQTSCKNKRNRPSSRTWCPAVIKFQKDESELQWKVVKFVEGHNHILYTPRKAHLMKQNREVPGIQKNLLMQFSEANIPTAQAFNVLSLQNGGIAHIGCTESDLRNFSSSLRNKMKECDAQLLADYFKEMQEMNPSFYYAIEVDNENKLNHCFWADGIARKAYIHFGDVVVFDTTYDTNKYHLIFAPFTGINHHRQSVCFGWGLLKDEKTESFVWLFDKFLEAMSGHAPGAIITDQDPAMKNAIAQVFPETFHRLCTWHILQKLPDKLRTLGHDTHFCTRLNNCVYNSRDPEEFEKEWDQIMKNFNVDNDKWLLDIYSIREKWIPVYFKNVFMAGVWTTQRSESLNAFFDKYVIKGNTLMEFIMHFRMAIERQRHNEFKANFDNLNTRPEIKTCWAIEKQMVGIYTQANFSLFQAELMRCAYYGAGFDNKNGDLYTYIVKKVDASTSSFRKVLYDKASHTLSCECMKFEYEGIPCKHILTTLRSVFISMLPEKLIMNRWTKSVTEGIVLDNNGVELQGDPRDPEKHKRKDELSALLGPFSKRACLSTESIEIAKEMISNFHSACDELGIGLDDDNDVGINARIPSQIQVRPPEFSKTKGSGKRLKGWKEKVAEQSKKTKRLCHGCKKLAHHDKRNCPNLKGMGASSATPLTDQYEPDGFDDISTVAEEEPMKSAFNINTEEKSG